MITWSKYPECKPENGGDIMVWRGGLFAEFVCWDGDDFITYNQLQPITNTVTHFTEINPPQSDIVQPSTEGC